jgi:hypothetical protein
MTKAREKGAGVVMQSMSASFRLGLWSAGGVSSAVSISGGPAQTLIRSQGGLRRVDARLEPHGQRVQNEDRNSLF